MWFGYNPQINFSYFFLQFGIRNFSGILTMKVNGQWVPCVRNFSYSFIPILLKLYKCLCHALKYACGLDTILILLFRNLNLVVLGVYTEKVNVVWIYVILRLNLCNLTIKAGDIRSLNLAGNLVQLSRGMKKSAFSDQLT